MRKKFIRTFSVFMAIVIVVAFQTEKSHAATWLNVNYIQQEQSKWCWAACAQIVGKYYSPGTTITQSQIVKHVKGSICNNPAAIDEMAEAARYATGNTVSFAILYNSVTFTTLKNIINNSWLLVPLVYSSTTSSGHYYVIYGYNETSTGNYLYSVNPSGGIGQYTSYSDFVNGTWTDYRPWIYEYSG